MEQVLYTLYDIDEQIIATGTARQICDAFRIKIGNFHCLVNRIKTGKSRNYVVYIERYALDQDPDAEDSWPMSWDLYDPRGKRGGAIHEEHSDQEAGQDHDSNGTRDEVDPPDRRHADPGGTMAGPVRKLGIFAF